MAKKLVIVESPSKSKTIEKYLGSDYKVVSSKGHISDLSTRGQFGLGVDIANGFKPDYVPIPAKKKVIADLKEEDYDRIIFNEITKDVVIDALKHPHKIDEQMVNSQETRRILDRIIGF